MTLREVAILSILMLCAAPAAARAQGIPKVEDLPRYFELTPRIGTGGQPTEAGFRSLAEKGYEVIVNLRTPNEGVDLAAEEKCVKDLGLRYYNIPVIGKEPRAEQAEAFLTLMEETKDQRVFVHCAAASRVGAFMLIQRVLKDGIPQEKAEEEARQIGLRSDILLKFARDFMSAKQQH